MHPSGEDVREPDRRRIDVDAHTIHYRVLDDLSPAGAPPIVLVHGQIVATDYLVPTLKALAPTVPAYAPDFPGFGLSSKPSIVLDVKDLAYVLLRWMDEMGLEQPILLANSYGCSIATELARQHPDRVDRLVLQGPTMEPSARGPLRSVWRGVQDLRIERPPPGMIAQTRRAGLRRALATWRHMYEDAAEDRLPHIATPTLVVRGASDPIASQAWAERFTWLLPQGRLVTIPGAHNLVWNEPAALAREVIRFLGLEQPPVAMES